MWWMLAAMFVAWWAENLYRGRRARRLADEVERLRVQMAGVSCAAQGHGLDDPAKPGDYGWSVPYDDVLRLRRRYEYAVRRLGISHDELWADLASEEALVGRATKGGEDPVDLLRQIHDGIKSLDAERDDLDRKENHGEGVQYRVSGERCGFVPPTPGYAPCRRDKGHGGPCAHDVLPPGVRRHAGGPWHDENELPPGPPDRNWGQL